MDIIDRLDNSETCIDAIDDAIAEIKHLRKRIADLETAQIKLERAMDDFHQSAIYDHDGIVLRMSTYSELRDAVKEMVEA
jgi:exonuclease VII small subunit